MLVPASFFRLLRRSRPPQSTDHY